MTPATYLEKIKAANSRLDLEWIGRRLGQQLENGDLSEAAQGVISDALDARWNELFPRVTAKPVSECAQPAADRDDPPCHTTHTRDAPHYPARKHVASPDREKSRIRKRKWAVSRMMPDWMAERFTEAPRAIGAVIALQYVIHGQCKLPIAAIAALAGASRSTYHNYKAVAVPAHDIEVIERPTRRGLSDTNIIRIRNKKWRQYLDRRKKMAKNRGCKKSDNPLTPTEEKVSAAEFYRVDNNGDNVFSRDGPPLCREALSGAPS